MARDFIEQVRRVVDEQTNKTGAVGNLFGVPDASEVVPLLAKRQAWYALQVSALSLPSLAQAIEQHTYERLPVEHLEGVLGVVQPSLLAPNYARLLLTLVRVSQARTMTIKVNAPGATVRVYLGSTLVMGGHDFLKGEVALPAGDTPLYILLYGGSETPNIELAADVECVRADPTPDAPYVRPVEFYEIDPGLGRVAARLEWLNDAMASAWTIYRASAVSLADIEATTDNGDGTFEFVLPGVHTTTIPVGTDLYGALYPFGRVQTVTDDTVDTTVTVVLDDLASTTAADWDTQTCYVAGAFEALTHVHNSGSALIVYDDGSVSRNMIYLYRVTAFGIFSVTESDLSPARWVFTNDHQAPDPVTIVNVSLDGLLLTVVFTTPTDLDYAGVRVYGPYASPPVAFSAAERVAVDFGEPDRTDQFSFRVVGSGTYYLAAFDRMGNEQGVADAVDYELVGLSNTIYNVREVEDSSTETEIAITWDQGDGVEEVWMAHERFNGPESGERWEVVRSAVEYISDTPIEVMVDRPAEGQVTLIQLESRVLDSITSELVATSVWRKVLFPAPVQVPAIYTDTIEVDGVGTLYWREQYRGLAITARNVYTKTGDAAIIGPIAPVRGPTDTSVVTGLEMEEGEYEADVNLDDTRLSYIWPYLTLENGVILPIATLPYDRNMGANLYEAIWTPGTTLVRVSGDTDTKCIELVDLGSDWKMIFDGSVYTFDVALADFDAEPGIGTDETRNFEARGYSILAASVVSGTTVPDSTRTVSVSTGTEAGGIEFAATGLTPPEIEDDDIVLVGISVTDTVPTGWYTTATARVKPFASWLNHGDITSELDPVPAEPGTSVFYHEWPCGIGYEAAGIRTCYVEITIYLYDDSDVLQDTETLNTSFPWQALP